ncbi:MAG: uracil-DNA glycosylase [Candidatus Competibacteraceae bacterium]|jgi:DNA polymerase|nr:uracil-DNA glycosylase [Candidatus Competibacteraceae bacterium]
MANSVSKARYLAALGVQSWELRRPLPLGSAALTSDALIEPQNINPLEVPMMPTEPVDDKAAEQPTALPRQDERSIRIADMDWEALHSEVSGCTACTLHEGRTQTVFGVGSQQADWLVIGEAPGADEDRLGEPFVGRAGKLLDAMLLALGLQREQVFIANILKCRPPKNRDPAPEEVRCCWPFLARQIALLNPKIILAVGRIAAQNLLQTDVPVGKLRNRIHRYQPGDIPVVVCYHPAYLLRSPREKRKAWDDLQLAYRTFSEERDAVS